MDAVIVMATSSRFGHVRFLAMRTQPLLLRIIVIDARGVIESFNPGAQRSFGYGAGEVIGRNVSMLMPSPFHEQHDGYLER
jgi:PAS domain S-box-containing protein